MLAGIVLLTSIVARFALFQRTTEYLPKASQRSVYGMPQRKGLRHASGPLDDDLADLEDRGQVGVVRNVAHNLLRVRPEGRLESLDGRAEDVAHADIGRGCAGCAAGQPLVHGVVQTCRAEALLDQGHVLVA